jgi:hypothetical protein
MTERRVASRIQWLWSLEMSIRRKVAANSGNWLRPRRLLKVKPRAGLNC